MPSLSTSKKERNVDVSYPGASPSYTSSSSFTTSGGSMYPLPSVSIRSKAARYSSIERDLMSRIRRSVKTYSALRSM